VEEGCWTAEHVDLDTDTDPTPFRFRANDLALPLDPKNLEALEDIGGVASPGRKGSAGEVEPAMDKEKDKRGVGFPFHFGGGGFFSFLFFYQFPC
jgi:hypothetical protein